VIVEEFVAAFVIEQTLCQEGHNGGRLETGLGTSGSGSGRPELETVSTPTETENNMDRRGKKSKLTIFISSFSLAIYS
jgi:hypothetical protein